MIHDVIVVGSGIAGLSLAQELRAQGRAPLVLERARGVGGRCATRRVEDQPVDHGLAFLHGRSAPFLARLAATLGSAGNIGWPHAGAGTEAAFQPRAFDQGEWRYAPSDGVNGFAKRLAVGLDVRLETRVESLQLAADRGDIWELRIDTGERLHSRTVALTMPVPSVLALVRQIDPPHAVLGSMISSLESIRILPCLTVIARYADGTPVPSWEASYSRASESRVVQAVLHDSSKRAGSPKLVLVIQGRPECSQSHLHDPPEVWTRMLIEEAAAVHGDWARTPDFVQSHRWRDAFVDVGTELAAPLVSTFDGGAVLGIAGDGLHSSGGAEGAYLSGVALSERLVRRIPA
ncbi:MAG: NAD(P)-binding protein [Acidobacteria bacterium]|nr:NAD(P)-binding protein [Acidobacteriota bacterium]